MIGSNGRPRHGRSSAWLAKGQLTKVYHDSTRLSRCGCAAWSSGTPGIGRGSQLDYHSRACPHTHAGPSARSARWLHTLSRERPAARPRDGTSWALRLTGLPVDTRIIELAWLYCPSRVRVTERRRPQVGSQASRRIASKSGRALPALGNGTRRSNPAPQPCCTVARPASSDHSAAELPDQAPDA
jgi:hypothetical protein